MTDIRLKQSGDGIFEAVTLDFLLTPAGDFDSTQELATAVTVALFSDRRAEDDDVLPVREDEDRRGWWGDTDAADIWSGWPIGSRLWLLSRAKILPREAREGATVLRVEEYIREALQPFIDSRIATDMDVSAVRNGIERIDASFTLYRGNKVLIERRYQDLWSNIQAI